MAILIAGLAVSGLTAFPIQTELRVLVKTLMASTALRGTALCAWLSTVRGALEDTNRNYPFLAYGTDWLAFAHLVMAAIFIGPWRDPVRNRWMFTSGLIACAAVIPLALIAGSVRGIPFGWRLLDCGFGVLGAIPLWICRQAVARLERSRRRPKRTHSCNSWLE